MFVAAMLVGAVWEELCFRATVLAIVQHTPAGLLLGIAAGSVVFGAQHLRNGVRRAAYACGFGAMFALLYVLTGNLVAVVTAHAAGNILGALQWTPQLERVRVETAAHPPSIFVG
jgi:membrane protease YdiL (CAAX protease family)